MEGVLKTLACGPDCGFVIRSHDEWEIISAAMEHAKEAHGLQDVTVQDIRSNIVVTQAFYRNVKPH